MSFLQPWMLIALPIALLPIIIHLINQRRYQTTQWAAMMFLLAANQMNRGYARVRQWAILALRTLVIAALIFAIGRPLASGSLGGGLIGSLSGGGSANTIVLLDRSPSMNAIAAGSSQTKLETGVAQIAETLQTLGVERVVLIDSNAVASAETNVTGNVAAEVATTLNVARELASPAELVGLPQTGPSDASADLPAMMLAALDHINANALGQTDVWICSDAREHDWQSRDGRWPTLREALAGFGRRVRFRLLTVADADQPNRSIRIEDVSLQTKGDESVLSLTGRVRMDSARTGGDDSESRSTTVTMDLDGAQSAIELPLDDGSGEFTGVQIPLGRDMQRGFGNVTLPADGNNADNTFYFVFDEAPPRRTVIVSSNEDIARVLQLAAEISPDENVDATAEVVTPEAVPSIVWNEVSLVLWQAPLPTSPSDAADLELLQAFVARGGRVLFFPSEKPDPDADLFGMKFDAWTSLGDDVSISTWRGDADLLSSTLAGAALPVGKLTVRRQSSLSGEATPLAKLSSGEPLLVRVPTPTGGVYFCGTTPLPTDSSLAADGVVMYVMIQRALAAGAASLANTGRIDAGRVDAEEAAGWRRKQGRGNSLSIENAFTAGVYADGDRWNVINRTAGEDSVETVKDSQIDELFQGLTLDRVDQTTGESKSLVDEIWRAFLVLMLLAMIGEAALCLPKHTAKETTPAAGGVAA